MHNKNLDIRFCNIGSEGGEIAYAGKDDLAPDAAAGCELKFWQCGYIRGPIEVYV